MPPKKITAPAAAL
jgi:hypothetical protein